jgi:mannose-6-phosphate isomerase-like protein (cupin superfamily)
VNDDLKMVAERLKGLRDVMNVSVGEAADVCGISADIYKQYEDGDTDIPVSVLHSMAKAYDFELTTLISGDEPHMKSYSLTRSGRGDSVERRKEYKYQSLAQSFIHRKAEPFLVIVEPDDGNEIHFNKHPGQEFNFIIEGTLQIVYDGKEMILKEGDSLYFDATKPHGMKALEGKPVKFLAIIF